MVQPSQSSEVSIMQSVWDHMKKTEELRFSKMLKTTLAVIQESKAGSLDFSTTTELIHLIHTNRDFRV